MASSVGGALLGSNGRGGQLFLATCDSTWLRALRAPGQDGQAGNPTLQGSVHPGMRKGPPFQGSCMQAN